MHLKLLTSNTSINKKNSKNQLFAQQNQLRIKILIRIIHLRQKTSHHHFNSYQNIVISIKHVCTTNELVDQNYNANIYFANFFQKTSFKNRLSTCYHYISTT